MLSIIEKIPRPIPDGYRVAVIRLNPQSFNMCLTDTREYIIQYHKSHNFNIAPPTISSKITVLHDVISEIPSAEGARELTADELVIVEKLPNGWYDKTLAKFDAEVCGTMKLFRLNWLLWIDVEKDHTLIHPTENRTLSATEINAIYDTAKIDAWLDLQVAYYHDNAWGEQDWESSYNPDTNTWEGGATNSAIKTFDLTQYRGTVFDYDKYPRLKRKNLPLKMRRL